MKINEAETAIREFEVAHDILQYEVDGWCVWPLFRLSAGYTLQGVNATAGRSMGLSQRLSVVAQDCLRLYRLRSSSYLIKSFVSGLADEAHGQYRDVWFGDLPMMLPGVLQIDGINNLGFLPRRKQALRPGDFTSAIFDTSAAVLSRIRTPPEVVQVAGTLAALLQTSFGKEKFSRERVEASISRFRALKRIYRVVLARVRPQFVMVADPGEFALAAAAKEQGIPVLELQHGVVYRDHHAYGWTSYALPYRSRMPVADCLLLYGEHWRQELAQNGFWGERLEVAGSLRMDAYRLRRRSHRQHRSGKQVLVTTQGIETERVMHFLAEFLATEEALDVQIIVKLHPAYEPCKKKFVAILSGDPRATVLLGSEGSSTFDLLTRADLHLSISSTCHYEALGLGVSTAILPFTSYEIMRPLYESGHAEILSTPTDIRVLLQRNESVYFDDAVGNYYFEPGALENICSVLGIACSERGTQSLSALPALTRCDQ